MRDEGTEECYKTTSVQIIGSILHRGKAHIKMKLNLLVRKGDRISEALS